ncbi:chitinase [Fodinicola feengrottensis]|uniref:chitinase n=1 Tax=Fodinicola feengrottensis TaxID=435914 RepID=UPI002441FC3A|nr:chitinase [Fodinicola feengrottensis]
MLVFVSGGTSRPAQAAVQHLPRHALIGFLHSSFGNDAGYLPINDVPDGWDIINVAFARSAGHGTMTLTRCAVGTCAGFEDDQAFFAGIQAQRAKGKKVLISLGGGDSEVRLTSASDVDNFVSSVRAIVDRWGLDGIDVDFEQQSVALDGDDVDFRHPTTKVVINLISALKRLKSHYGRQFVLTMAPETLGVQLGHSVYGPGRDNSRDARSGAFLPIIYALRDDLTVLAVQDYNSDPILGSDNRTHQMGDADFPIAMTDMLLTGFTVAGDTNAFFPGLRADQVVVGLPANTHAARRGWIPPGAQDQVLDCLMRGQRCGSYAINRPHPSLRGLMTWSINWDSFNHFEFQRTFDAYFRR